jgi:hemerythrin-like domain-containing protein
MAEMDRLERDHKKAQGLHDEVDHIGTRWLTQATISAEERQRFRAAVDALEEIYRKHIELEDQEVFPIAARVLSAEEQREVGLEMARRRSQPGVVGIAGVSGKAAPSEQPKRS